MILIFLQAQDKICSVQVQKTIDGKRYVQAVCEGKNVGEELFKAKLAVVGQVPVAQRQQAAPQQKQQQQAAPQQQQQQPAARSAPVPKPGNIMINPVVLTDTVPTCYSIGSAS